MVAKRYRKQDHRGKQGFAFVEVDGEGKAHEPVREMTEVAILKRLADSVAGRILFHHRLPTSTVNIPCATHPIVVDNELLRNKYYVVHNGVLRNSDTLKKKHNDMGFDYTTEIVNETYHTGKDGKSFISESDTTYNDSEALAIDLALTLEGVQETMLSTGTIAFIALVCDKDDNAIGLVWGRNGGNPLVMEMSSNAFSIKSEGEGKEVDVDTLYSYEFANGVESITTKPFEVGSYYTKTPAKDWSHMGYGTAHKTQEERDEDWWNGWCRRDDGTWGHQDHLPLPECRGKIRDVNPYDNDEIEDYSFSKHWDEYQSQWWIVDALKLDIANAEFDGAEAEALKEELKVEKAKLEEIEFEIMREEYGEGIGA